MTQTRSARPSLAPYVPRVVKEWLDSPNPASMHRGIEGTAVFVDVSGFTQMSERMARLGKAGAEEVTEIIDGCFSALLNEAYAYGGTLIKFGGDALLLFFRDQAHEHRGAAAALAMRSTLRGIREFETPIGKVTLRMSVGVHSGRFDFFLVGTSHRELVFAGHAATTVVTAENEADTGQILVSHPTGSTLPAVNLGPTRRTGRLLRGRLDAPEATLPAFKGEMNLDLSVPKMLRDRALAGAGQAEHRATVVAFIDVRGFDGHLADLGPVVVATELHSLVSDIQQATEAHGVCFLGTDVDTDGFKVILTAGSPVSTGTDEESMLLALREIVEVQRPFDIRVGVNRGPVFAGEVGARFRRTYTVMGDAVNLAARVMSRAEPGQILVTPPVLDGSRTLFETTPVEPFHVKGKREPVAASIVGAPRGARSTIAVGELPLIGRDEELATLLEAWEAAMSGQGRVVGLAGETGSGKSRLLAEFLRRGHVASPIRAECRLYQSTTAYFPFLAFVRQALNIDDVQRSDLARELEATVNESTPELLPWLSLIGTVAGVDIPPSKEVRLLDDEFRRIRLEEAVTALLGQVVDGPTVFVVEDAQWMDDASSDLMNRLIETASGRPWLIILVRRPGDSGFVADDPESFIRLELGPLASDSTEELILQATKSSPLRSKQVETLVTRSEGSPLFLIELLEAVQRSDDVDALPDSVEGLIQARIDTLDPVDRDLLQHVSVLGSNFQSRHAAAVLPLSQSEIGSSLRSFPEFLIVGSNEKVQFRNALIRDVAYEGLPYKLRRHLHAQVAQSIRADAGHEQDARSELLSLHFYEAGLWPEAREFSLKAGAKSDAVYANLEAAVFYQRALTASKRLGGDDSEILSLAEARGEALWRAGLFDESLQAYGLALSHGSSDPVRQADLMLKRARVRAFGGNYSAGLGELTKARRLLESDDTKSAQGARARLDSFRAVIRMMQGRSEDALDLAEVAVVDAAEAGEKEALARAYTVLDAACLTLGRSSEADYLPLALAMYEEMDDLLGVALANNNMGERAWLEGRFDDAVDLYSKAYEADSRAGNDPGAAFDRLNVGEVLIAQGRMSEARVILEDSSRVLRAHGSEAAVGADIHLARVALAEGDVESSIEILQAAVDETVEMGHMEWAHLASIHLAAAYAGQGQTNEALELLSRAEAEIDQGGDLYVPLLERVRAETLSNAERPREALERALIGRDAARQLGMSYEEDLLESLVAELST